MVWTVRTRTICPFPLTFNEELLEIYRANRSIESELTTANCTATFADHFGPGWFTFQYTTLIICVLGALFVSYQLNRTYSFSKKIKHRYFSLTQTRVYICTLVILLSLALICVDINGLNNVIPTHVSLFCNEIITCAFLLLLLLIIDFWACCAKGGRVRNELGLPYGFIIGYGSVALFISVGMELVAMLDSTNYFIWLASKYFAQCIMVILIFFIAQYQITIIRRKLLDMRNSSSAASRGNQPISVSYQASVDRIIHQLSRKYRAFSGLLLFAVIVLIANGTCTLVKMGGYHFPHDYALAYFIFDTPYYVFLALMIVLYLVCAIILIHFFRVPKEKPSRKREFSRWGPATTLHTAKEKTDIEGGPAEEEPTRFETRFGQLVIVYEDSTKKRHSTVESFHDLELIRATIIRELEGTQERREQFIAFCQEYGYGELVACFEEIHEFESENRHETFSKTLQYNWLQLRQKLPPGIHYSLDFTPSVHEQLIELKRDMLIALREAVQEYCAYYDDV